MHCIQCVNIHHVKVLVVKFKEGQTNGGGFVCVCVCLELLLLLLHSEVYPQNTVYLHYTISM